MLLGQWRAQPGRLLTAVIAIAIGVCLALAIDLVNRSALSEFGQALSVVNGEAQASVQGGTEGFEEALFGRLLAEPAILSASPVVESTLWLESRSLRVFGLDPMRAAAVSPGLLPQPGVAGAQGSASSIFADDAIFLSAAALHRLGLRVGQRASFRHGLDTVELTIAGTVPGAAAGQAIAVMDIGAAQWRLRWLGRISRIDLRLAEGVDARALAKRWASSLPADAQWSTPQAGEQRMSNLSRAYRVNLSVLALVALLTGAFIVHATVALAAARQAPELALLAMLGARPRFGLACVLTQGLVLGVAGSILGLLAGLALATVLMHHLGADLGGGYFSGLQGALEVEPATLVGFGLLGIAASLAGSIGPAIALRQLAPAQAIRNPADMPSAPARRALALVVTLSAAGSLLAMLPAWRGLPIAAYAAIACWLFAGILLIGPLTAVAGRLLDACTPWCWRNPSAWFALQRIRRAPHAAAVALSGVVASFALASAMTIMVDSFRHSVSDWLDKVLPADLYLRTGATGPQAALSPEIQRTLAQIPGVAGVEFLRSLELSLDADKPPVALLARDVQPGDPARHLPLVGESRAPQDRHPPIWVSEAMVDLYAWTPGRIVAIPLAGRMIDFEVAGVWRDYARQHGAVVILRTDYIALTADTSANDIALRLAQGADETALIGMIAQQLPVLAAFEWRSAREIRQLSIRIFDRSFAVTYVLEVIAILVGLFGVAATYTGQALARAREFGVLRHLGVTRRQIMGLFAIESALLVSTGVVWGGILGGVIAVILVHRVNPQSFHWTMDMHLPGPMLTWTAVSLVVLGVAAAVMASRAAAGRSPLRAVREDW